MALTTVEITGRVPLPTDEAADASELVLILSGWDTEGDDVILPAAIRIVLVDGEIPAGTSIWATQSGTRARSFTVMARWTDRLTTGHVAREVYLGVIQTSGDDESVELAAILNSSPPAPPNSYWMSITEAQYNGFMAAYAAMTGASAEATGLPAGSPPDVSFDPETGLFSFWIPDGAKGGKGDDGPSAYAVAVAEGFVGTEAQWLASLKGDAGPSAYDVAVAEGFEGDEAAWLASLEGDAGDSAYQVAVEQGFEGDEAEWLASLAGSDGASAYQVAVAEGFSGDEDAWLASLVGPEGPSAYAVAVANGFVGDEDAWLLSLEGTDGEAGDDGDKGWSPILAAVADGSRVVHQVVDWTGGEGTKPATGDYISSAGLTPNIASATDIRGAAGSGSGDMVASIYDPDGLELPVYDMDSMIEGADAKIMTSAERSKLSGIDLSLYQALSGKGAANGYAGLDSSGLIPENLLPAIAITDTSVVSSQSAMLALTAQVGDIAVRTDVSKTFVLASSPATTLANWVELRAPTAAVTSVALSAPTGFSVSGSPVTATGTLTFSYATGYQGFTSAEAAKLATVADNANNYSHPTGDGNLHIPATSTTNDGKFLKAGATAGSAAWAAPAISEINGLQTALDAKAATSSLGSLAAKNKAAVADIDATGTPTSDKFLRGDGQWVTIDLTNIAFAALGSWFTTYGGVGTYVLAQQRAGTATASGGTTAGSNLTPASASGSDQTTGLSGTWRLMGRHIGVVSGSQSEASTSLWLRIS